ncbi:hypothetical protein DYB32_004055 [Aphanomyces invadans]|uniref:Uncharacterized protein n=1 Tax=Aphanomyces invadans TaxID=157072 RepID=A0A418AYN8_9STRA|nr:hypothetical protein DYB32_004055 [Aphanomyces invadans]
MDPDEFVPNSQSEDEVFWNEVDEVALRAAHADSVTRLPSKVLTGVESVSAQVLNDPVSTDRRTAEQTDPSLAPPPKDHSGGGSYSNDTSVIPDAARAASTDTLPSTFNVGDLVEVETRTWPGINKIGGAARVTRVYEENGDAVVDVRYFLGGSERAVCIDYVRPSSIYEKKSRQRRSRKFFHDEFANEYLPTRRVIAPDIATASATAPVVTRGQFVEPTKVHKVAKKTNTTTKYVDLKGRENFSSSSSNDDDYGDNTPLYHRFQNLSKLLKPPKARSHDSEGSTSDKSAHISEVPRQFRQERGEVVSVLESHTVRPPLPTGATTGRLRAQAIQAPRSKVSSSSDDDEMETAQAPRKKRRRFVGGYDGDNDFIQPEDNAMDLPEDVQHDTGFTLARTTKLLWRQYQTHSMAFVSALQTFQSLRDAPLNPAHVRRMSRGRRQC